MNFENQAEHQEMKSFASDNYSGVHPIILKSIEAVNIGHCTAYGNDPYTTKAIKLFKQQFGENCDVYFVLTGTAANVLSMQTLLKSHQAVICAESAHINVDECGAPEKFIGCKLLTIPTTDGKLSIESIKNSIHSLGDQHRVQPKVISISEGSRKRSIGDNFRLL